MYAQRAEAVVQVPYPEASVGAAFPLQEEAVDGGPGEWLGQLGRLPGDVASRSHVRCLDATRAVGLSLTESSLV